MQKLKLILISTFLIAAYVGTKHFADERVRLRDLSIDVRYLPSPQFAEWAAIGFKEAMADFYWIDALNYFGEQLGRKKTSESYKYLKSYIELIFHLDSLFSYFYDWAATVFIYNGMPIHRDGLVNAIDVANLGIRRLNEIERYNDSLIQKGAFNYALDAQVYPPSLPYFELLARSFPEHRDRLLVASAYAKYSKQLQKSYEYRKEFLAYKAFETQSKAELNYAVANVFNSALTQQAFNFAKALRIQMEQDEDLRKIVQNQLQERGTNIQALSDNEDLSTKSQDFEFLKHIDLSKNWMPPNLHLLLQIHKEERPKKKNETSP